MRFYYVLPLILLCFLALPRPAQAGTIFEFMCWLFPCSGNENFERPYLEDGKTPHNSQWEKDSWTPQDWVDDKHSAQDVMSGFYRAGIITGQHQYFWNGAPAINVGQGFMRLSGQDKRRVIRFVDEVSGLTRNSPSSSIMIYHEASGEAVGIYNSEGLQLQ